MQCSTPELTALSVSLTLYAVSGRFFDKSNFSTPNSFSLAGFVYGKQQFFMLGDLLVVGRQQGQIKPAQVDGRGAVAILTRTAHVRHQGLLSQSEVDRHVGQQLGIEQGAVQRAARVVNL